MIKRFNFQHTGIYNVLFFPSMTVVRLGPFIILDKIKIIKYITSITIFTKAHFHTNSCKVLAMLCPHEKISEWVL